MGVISCTGPICEVGVLDYNAGWGVGCVRSSLRVPLPSSKWQVSVSTEAPTLEEYKHSASVQSLLLLLETGYGLNTGTKSRTIWGANAHCVVDLHQVKRMHNHNFCHCLG